MSWFPLVSGPSGVISLLHVLLVHQKPADLDFHFFHKRVQNFENIMCTVGLRQAGTSYFDGFAREYWWSSFCH